MCARTHTPTHTRTHTKDGGSKALTLRTKLAYEILMAGVAWVGGGKVHMHIMGLVSVTG